MVSKEAIEDGHMVFFSKKMCVRLMKWWHSFCSLDWSWSWWLEWCERKILLAGWWLEAGAGTV